MRGRFGAARRNCRRSRCRRCRGCAGRTCASRSGSRRRRCSRYRLGGGTRSRGRRAGGRCRRSRRARRRSRRAGGSRSRSRPTRCRRHARSRAGNVRCSRHVQRRAHAHAAGILLDERIGVRIEQRLAHARERGLVVRLREVNSYVMQRLAGTNGVLPRDAHRSGGSGGARSAWRRTCAALRGGQAAEQETRRRHSGADRTPPLGALRARRGGNRIKSNDHQLPWHTALAAVDQIGVCFGAIASMHAVKSMQ